MRKVLIELLVLLVGNLGARQRPQRCGRVYDLVFLVISRMQGNRKTDVVRVLANQGLDAKRLEKLCLILPQVQSDAGATLLALGILDGEFALAIGRPTDRLLLVGTPSFDRDRIRDNKG